MSAQEDLPERTCIQADLSGVKIAGVACAVPEPVDDLSGYRAVFGDKSVDKFIHMIGVKQRHIAREEQTASDLAYAAAQYLLEQESVDRQELGACILVTQTPDYRLPSTACVLHKRLGLPRNCLAFDVNLGCSGYVYGLNIAASLMKSNHIAKCLLLTADTLNKAVSEEDKVNCMLMGDAGAATLLVLDKNTRMYGSFKSDGNGFKSLIVPAGAYRNRQSSRERTVWKDGGRRSDFELYMNGMEVFVFTISEVPELIREHMSWRGRDASDYDAFVLHQANYYILEQVAKKAKIPFSKVPVSVDRYGNTSPATIPLTLCDAYGDQEGVLKTLLCGFGVGLSWGVVDAEIDAAHIYPIIQTDNYYTEGSVSLD